MKNREYKTLVAIVLAMTMVAGTLSSASTVVYAKENHVKTESSADKTDTKSDKKSSSDVKTLKDETVYAKIDGSGTVTSVTVSDQLKNVTDISRIKDVSTLENIENVKGDEAFSQNSSTLTWSGDSKDICYQGTTDQTLPVGVKITYKLDGKDISADQLDGKSGHLVLRYQYENTTAKSGKEYTPFLMVTGLILDTDKFTNVKVTNGKLVSDGDRDMVLGMGLPEMKSTLGVKDLNIPDYFEMEADVTDYETVEGITIATNEIFNELETDKLDDLSDLKSSMKKLQDSADQLVDGSGELRKGLDTLLSSSQTLKDGIGQLADGSKTLKTGTGTLLDGSRDLADGSSLLADGTGQLAEGAGILSSGTQKLNAGLGLVSKKVSGELLPGVKTLDAGVLEMQKSLGEKLPVLCQGVSDLNAGITQAADGAAALDAGIQKTADGAAALNSGIQQAADGAAALDAGVQSAAASARQLSEAAGALSAALSGNSAVTYSADTTDSYDEIAQLQALRDSLASDENANVSEETLGTLNSVIDSLSWEQEQRNGISAQNAEAAADVQTPAGMAQTIADGASALYDSLASGDLAAGAARLDAAMNTGDPSTQTPSIRSASQAISSALNDGDASTGVPSIRLGAQSLDAALNSGDPANGVPSIRAGIGSLNEGVNGKEGLGALVNAGVSQLKAGTSQLLSGIDGKNGLTDGLNQLSTGASSVNSGAATLNEKMADADKGAKNVSDGASRLSSGAGELNTGAGTLADGIQTLQTGSDALIDGVKQLDDGAKTLNDGMIRFNEEGIQKLVSAFDGDIEGMLDKLNTMVDASKNYKNFSGISDEMDGEVKFIFVTNK